jgi:hypothetical protein
MDTVTVYNTLNVADAEVVASRLEAAGFTVAIDPELDAFASCGLLADGIRIRVPADQAKEVSEFLAAPETEAPPIT